MRHLSVTLEVLHVTFMFLGGRSGLEGAEVAPLLGLGVDFPRVQAVLAATQLANHARYLAVACGLKGGISEYRIFSREPNRDQSQRSV
jgi:hypothetical protein